MTLAPGARTILHKHGVPMFAYILDGEITVDFSTHGKHRKGQSLMEAMRSAFWREHRRGAAALIAVYMGGAQRTSSGEVRRSANFISGFLDRRCQQTSALIPLGSSAPVATRQRGGAERCTLCEC